MVLDGKSSQEYLVNAGVPQDSITIHSCSIPEANLEFCQTDEIFEVFVNSDLFITSISI